MADKYLVINTQAVTGFDPYDLYLPHVRCMECGVPIGEKKISGEFIKNLKQGLTEAEAIDEVSKIRFPDYWQKALKQQELAEQGLPNDLPEINEIVEAGLEQEENITTELQTIYYFRRLYHRHFKDCCIRYIRRPMQIQIGRWLGIERAATIKNKQIALQTTQVQQSVSGGLEKISRPRGRMYTITRDKDATNFLPGMRVESKTLAKPKLPSLSLGEDGDDSIFLRQAEAIAGLQEFAPQIKPSTSISLALPTRPAEQPGFTFSGPPGFTLGSGPPLNLVPGFGLGPDLNINSIPLRSIQPQVAGPSVAAPGFSVGINNNLTTNIQVAQSQSIQPPLIPNLQADPNRTLQIPQLSMVPGFNPVQTPYQDSKFE